MYGVCQLCNVHLGCYTSLLQSDSQAENSPSLGRKPFVFPKRHPGWQTDSKMSESTDSGLDRMQMLPSAEPFELVCTVKVYGQKIFVLDYTHETSQLLLFVTVTSQSMWLHQFHAIFCHHLIDSFVSQIFSCGVYQSFENKNNFRCYEKKLDFLIVYMYLYNNNRHHNYTIMMPNLSLHRPGELVQHIHTIITN